MKFLPLIPVFLGLMATASAAERLSVEKFCEIGQNWSEKALEASRNRGQVVDRYGRKRLHRGCQDVSWMKQTREALCENKGEVSQVNLPDKFLFVFDGFGGFNTKLGTEFGAINVLGDEPDDFGKGYGKGISAFMEAFEKGSRPEASHQLHYYASSGFTRRENLDSAVACADQLKTYLDIIELTSPREKLPKWIAFGFSNGGERAITFQDYMAKKRKFSLDLVLTVDPVAQWGAFFFNELKQTIGEKHALTRRLVNIYQTIDRTSFPRLGLRGKPVRKADENVLLGPEHIPNLAQEQFPHGALMVSELVIELMTCELRKLDFPEASACDYSRFKKP